MQFFGLCHVGAESALVKELHSFGITATPLHGACEFSATQEEASLLCYKSQVLTRLLIAVCNAPLANLDVKPVHDIIPEDSTFKVAAQLIPGSPTDTSGQEVAAEVGAMISRPVDLSKPDFVVFVQVGPSALCGVDVAGDLSKRYYRIFTSANSIKGTLAAAILWEYAIEGGILDPFGSTGEIAIEAALRATGTSPLKFEKHRRIIPTFTKEWEDSEHPQKHRIWCFDGQLGNLRSSKKNAKLAGIDKAITFSKTDAEWIDVKFEENEVANIVTLPTPVTKRNPGSEHIKELCYQAAYVLGPGGRLVVGCRTEETAAALLRYAKDYKLSFLGESVVYSGQAPLHIVAYGM